MRHLLPESSFVSFQAQGLAQPDIAWFNSRLSSPTALQTHAFCLPMEGEPAEIYCRQRKAYCGERYGGEGLGSNGGGVRCGLDDQIQIKGIGKNPLAGTKTGFWNSYGGAALEAGIREAIWGEICHHALPFGAASVHGIIRTGSNTPYKGLNGERRAHRVLIVRQAALRPAHYMRAADFAPSEDVERRYPHDTERTRAAINMLHVGLSNAMIRPATNHWDPVEVNACMKEFSRRMAFQMAAAGAKRIVHGSLNSSNVCLNGAWIDFDKTTAVSDYGKIVTGTAQPVLWDRQDWFGRMTSEWLYFMQKYLPPKYSSELCLSSELDEYFHAQLVARYETEFLKLTGIPESALGRIDVSSRRDAFLSIREIVQSGNGEPFKYDPGHCWEMPVKMGHHHLNSVLQAAAVCKTPDQIRAALSADLGDGPMLDRFARAHHDLVQAYLCGFDPSCREAADEFRIVNALRSNAPLSELYRPYLDRRIDQLIEENAGVARFIEDLVSRAAALLGEPHEGELDLSCLVQRPLRLKELENKYEFAVRIRGESLEQVVGVLVSATEQSRVKALWKACR